MCDVHMVRLRIIMRGSEQCVRLIWSVIVLRWSYTDFRFRAMPCIKSSQIDSSRAVAGRRLVYGGHDDAGVYHTTSVDPHACSKSCVELYPRLVFFYVLLSSRKTPDNYPSSRALGAAPAPTASRGAAMQCTGADTQPQICRISITRCLGRCQISQRGLYTPLGRDRDG